MKATDLFPVGFWNYVPIKHQGPAAARDWAGAGITVAMGPIFGPTPEQEQKMTTILDAAHAHGMQVILWHEHSLSSHLSNVGKEQYRQDIERLVDRFGAHPATFGFVCGDEPEKEHFDDHCLAYRIQKAAAPHLSPLLNLLPNFHDARLAIGYDSYSGYLDDFAITAKPDFLSYDCYSQMCKGTNGWDMYFENLQAYSDASRRHGVPYWTTLLSAGHGFYRVPNEDDLRWQLSTAIAHGAQGILWYFFYLREPQGNYRIPPIDEHYERTQTYQSLSRVNRTFLKTIAPVMRELTLKRVSHVEQAWGGVPLFDGSGLVSRARAMHHKTPLIVSEFTHSNSSNYIMVVNNSIDQDTQAELYIRGRRPTTHQVGWLAQEDLPVSSECKTHQDHCVVQPWLAPGQMELFRVDVNGG